MSSVEVRRCDRRDGECAISSRAGFEVSAFKPAAPGFAQPDLMDWLETADDAALDRLDFGVIAMSQDGIVVAYNAAESRLAGLRAAFP